MRDGNPSLAAAEAWLGTAQGRHVLAAEVLEMRRVLNGVFGDQMLQIGAWGGGVFLKAARTRRTAVVGEAALRGVELISAIDDLAVPDDSIDAVLLAHVLEAHPDPHAVLREVDRILRPDGHLIVAGFNPYGTWGFRHRLSRGRFPPGASQLISEGRLCDWLRLLNFSTQESRFYHYQLPFGAGTARRRPRADKRPYGPPWLRRTSAGVGAMAGQVWKRVRSWPPFAACYLITARKEMYTATPVRPVRPRSRRLVAGLVNPTTRNAA